MRNNLRVVYMPRTNAIYGGIKIDAGMTPSYALNYYIQHSRSIRVVSTNSAYCIGVVLKFEYNTGCPYTHTRPTNYGKPVQYIFVKLMMSDGDHPEEDEFTVRNNHMRFATKKFVEDEVKTQLNIYQQSFSDLLFSPGDALCPAILAYGLDVVNKDGNDIISQLLKIEYERKIKGPYTDIDIFNEFIMETDVAQRTMSFIAMEFLEDYIPLYTYIKTYGQSLHINSLVLWELYKLYALYGFLHTDAHAGNIFVNKKIDYLNDRSKMGRVMILDFGLGTFTKPNSTKINDVLQTLFDLPYPNRMQNSDYNNKLEAIKKRRLEISNNIVKKQDIHISYTVSKAYGDYLTTFVNTPVNTGLPIIETWGYKIKRWFGLAPNRIALDTHPASMLGGKEQSGGVLQKQHVAISKPSPEAEEKWYLSEKEVESIIENNQTQNISKASSNDNTDIQSENTMKEPDQSIIPLIGSETELLKKSYTYYKIDNDVYAKNTIVIKNEIAKTQSTESSSFVGGKTKRRRKKRTRKATVKKVKRTTVKRVKKVGRR